MTHLTTVLTAILLLPQMASAFGVPSPSKVRLREWEKGISVEPLTNKEMKVYLWFYEWNLFDARKKGPHTAGSYKWRRTWSKNGRTATIHAPDMKLTAKAIVDGVDLTLTITNKTKHPWTDVAAIIPCFNPGPPPGQAKRFPLAKLNPAFNNQQTWFVGEKGLQKLVGRAIHFNHTLRQQVDKLSTNGRFVFSFKWPTSKANAHAGLLIRESTDRKWVTAIAWDRYLTAQGHNPWQCMHLSIRVGPLKPGEQQTIRGKIYLFQGDREECWKRYKKDFATR